ncbi:ATP-dependent DNA helicase [Methanocaldococcus infernus]
MNFLEFVSKKFPYSSIREPQKKMMLSIYNSIINRKHLIVEAPTGVGKTLAYLLPAIYFAEQGKRILILTETIDQQKRIFDELNRLNHNLKVSYLMGIRNYTCKTLNRKANRIFCKINYRCRYRPNKKPICFCGMRKIKVGSLYYCPLCVCEYKKCKLESLVSNIVVMNNTMFFYSKEDCGDFDIIIVDEAHKLEDSIRRALTIEINPDTLIERLKYMAFHYSPSVLRKRMTHDNVFDLLKNYLDGVDIDLYRRALIYDDGELDSFYNLTKSILSSILNAYYKLIKLKEKILEFEENEEIKEEIKFDLDFKDICLVELNFINKVKSSDLLFNEFFENISKLRLSDNYVLYRSGNSLIYEPVFVNNYLKTLYGNAVVIHCSATIGSFKSHAHRTGLEDANFLRLESPFPMERREIIALKDGANMKYEVKDREKANEIILKMLEAINDNTLILFKSFEDLENFYNYLKLRIDKLNLRNKKIHVYERGMGGEEAKELQERFKKEGGILLATGRFSEGVDFPGETLVGVIIDSLPFPVPTPLLKKEREILMKRVGSWEAFLLTSFDRMAKTLVQMIGRLIRTEKDYGVVVIQDKRFYEWVGDTLRRRGYIRDYKVMSVGEAINYIPRFIKKYKNT